MQGFRRIVVTATMTAASFLIPALSVPSGANSYQGVINGLIEHCPSHASYRGQVTISLFYAKGTPAMSTATEAKTKPTHFSWWVLPGNYYITVHGRSALRGPLNVRYFHVAVGQTVRLPPFKEVCSSN